MSIKEKFKRKPQKMRVKLFSSLLIFVFISLFLLWSFQVFLLDTFYLQLTKTRMANTVAEIEALETDKTVDYPKEIFKIALENEFCISVFGADGRIKARADVGGGCLIHNLDDKSLNSLYKKATDNGGEYFHRAGMRDFRENFKAKVPVRDRILLVSVVQGEKGPLVIFFDTATSPVKVIKAALTMLLILNSLVLTVLCAIIANFLAKKLSKPISDVNRAAKRLTHGEYDVEFTGEGYREIHELSETLNQAANDLKRTDKMQKDLIANISHDLRTPLTLITGYCEMMRDIEGENTPENMQVVIDEANRMSMLVSDLIDLSKYESGAVKIEKQSVDIDFLILETVQRYRKLMAEDGYMFEYDSHGPTFVDCDKKRILQVLYNLVNNAVNYGGDDKKVIIRLCDSESGKKRVEVIDHGEGIAKEDLPYIFDRYYKVDKVHDRTLSSTGIGLAIVKNVLGAHGAPYGVVSEIGMGSLFYFEL